MKAWIVYDTCGHWLDEVFFEVNCDKDYVRSSLINHDGYPNSITVLPAR